MKTLTLPILTAALALAAGHTARASFLIQIDVDGSTAGNTVSYHPNFSFGTGTTTASGSVASTAVGLATGNSLFGGDAADPVLDTYVFTYTPSTTAGDTDNLPLAAGTALNGSGSAASGLPAGSSGQYAVYAAWPSTTNVGGGPTTFHLDHDGGTLDIPLDQNNRPDEWHFLGTVSLTEGTSYSLSQIAGGNTFVSMRSSGVLFDLVPEPATTSSLLLAAATLTRRRRPSPSPR